MEKFKDPAMLLSVANSIGIVGTTAYFYKQLESVRTDLMRTSQAIVALTRKLGEMEKADQHQSETLRQVNEQIKRINETLADMPSFDNIADVESDLSEIVAVLDENSIIVERPSQLGRQIRSGDRRDRRPARLTSEVESRPYVRGLTDRTRDQERRPQTQPRPQQQQQQQQRPYPNDQRHETGDDIDLISQVRMQQSRV